MQQIHSLWRKNCASPHNHVYVYSYTLAFARCHTLFLYKLCICPHTHRQARTDKCSTCSLAVISMHTLHIRQTPCANTSYFFPTHKPNIYSCSDMGLNDGRTFQQFLFSLWVFGFHTLPAKAVFRLTHLFKREHSVGTASVFFFPPLSTFAVCKPLKVHCI